MEKEFARQPRKEGIRAQAPVSVRDNRVCQEKQVGPVYQEFQVRLEAKEVGRGSEPENECF